MEFLRYQDTVVILEVLTEDQLLRDFVVYVIEKVRVRDIQHIYLSVTLTEVSDLANFWSR